MKKLITLCVVSVAAAAPATAAAADPSPADFKNAAKYCKAFKAAAGSNFATMFGTKKNAYGKCVSATAKKTATEDAKQEKAAKANAAKDCSSERTADPAAFTLKYGSGPNGRNAYGKCVSTKAKAKKAEADKEDKAEASDRVNAAKTCKAAKKADPAAFAVAYGSKRNAFGKCVSKEAKARAEARQAT